MSDEDYVAGPRCAGKSLSSCSSLENGSPQYHSMTLDSTPEDARGASSTSISLNFYNNEQSLYGVGSHGLVSKLFTSSTPNASNKASKDHHLLPNKVAHFGVLHLYKQHQQSVHSWGSASQQHQVDLPPHVIEESTEVNYNHLIRLKEPYQQDSHILRSPDSDCFPRCSFPALPTSVPPCCNSLHCYIQSCPVTPIKCLATSSSFEAAQPDRRAPVSLRTEMVAMGLVTPRPLGNHLRRHFSSSMLPVIAGDNEGDTLWDPALSNKPVGLTPRLRFRNSPNCSCFPARLHSTSCKSPFNSHETSGGKKHEVM